MPTHTTVFISYARKDNENLDPSKRWLDRLREHLEPLVQEENMTLCSDQDIKLGELKDSELGPLVLATLGQETDIAPVAPYTLEWITTGIRAADYYFRLIRQSAGTRDWQRDFAETATPILVGVARSLQRSADAQAIIVRLCEAVTQRLRLELTWPADPDELNDVRNALYRECLDSREVESDQVLIILQGLVVIGPG